PSRTEHRGASLPRTGPSRAGVLMTLLLLQQLPPAPAVVRRCGGYLRASGVGWWVGRLPKMAAGARARAYHEGGSTRRRAVERRTGMCRLIATLKYVPVQGVLREGSDAAEGAGPT